MEPDNSLPHSQVHATCPYPEHATCFYNNLPDDEPVSFETYRRRQKLIKWIKVLI